MQTDSSSNRPPPPGAIEIPRIDGAAVVGADPRQTPRNDRPRSVNLWRWLPWVLGMVVLLIALWGFVTIRPVVVSTEPAATSLRLAGGQAWRSGETWYLTAGDWTVAAELAGYHPLDESFQVSRTGVNEFRFVFDPLPGKVVVQASDAVTGEAITGISYTINGETANAETAIPPGSVEAVVEHPDYLSARAAIEVVGRDTVQELRVELTPRRGVLVVRKLLPQVAVWIAGEQRGRGPGEWALEPGEYPVELRRSGYRSWERTVTVASGQRTVIDDAELVPLPAAVHFRTNPPGAQILLDNAVTGIAPFSRDLAPGVYAARAVLAGYHPQERVLELQPGQEVEVAFELTAITGKLMVAAPNELVILIDGEVWTDAWPAELPVGPHRVEARMEGLPPMVRTVVVQAGQQVTLTFTPPKQAEPEPEPAPEPAAAKGNPLGIETVLVRVPNEPFTIGSPRGEPGRRANEAQRRVRLSRDFHLGIAEITNAEFAKFDANHQSGTNLDQPEQPVVAISWDQAARFCNYLSELDGLPPAYVAVDGAMKSVWPLTAGWRLPTEAEWELAARLGAPANSTYPWGAQLPPPAGAANLADETFGGVNKLEGYNDKFAHTAPVKSFAASALGLFDVAGNVGEWCHDYYNLSSGNLSRLDVDPAGPERGVHHVVKGSSYRHYQMAKLRPAFRDYSAESRDDVGFRIARFAKENDK